MLEIDFGSSDCQAIALTSGPFLLFFSYFTYSFLQTDICVLLAFLHYLSEGKKRSSFYPTMNVIRSHLYIKDKSTLDIGIFDSFLKRD